MKFALFFIIFIICSRIGYSQKISGSVFHQDVPLPYASVTIFDEKDSVYITLLTDEQGWFQTTNYKNAGKITIAVTYIGLKQSKKSYTTAELSKPLLIKLERSKQDIEEIQVIGELNKVMLDVNKRVYKFNQSDFIKNTTADIAINKVPGVVFSEEIGLKLDGYQTPQLYINGIASSTHNLKNIEVDDIEQVDIVNHPSARFNVERSSGIINIITKHKATPFYKGRLQVTKGTLLERTGVNPSFSFKKGKWLVKMVWDKSRNVQKTNTDMYRSAESLSYYQFNFRKSTVVQDNGNIEIRRDIDTTSSIFLRSAFFGYKLNGNTTGKINNIEFLNASRDKYWIYTIDGVYDKKIREGLLSIKGNYNLYRKEDSFLIEKEEKFENTINSGLSDIALETSFNHKPDLLNWASHDFGAKYVNRTFLQVENIKYKQHNIGIYSDWRIKVNPKIEISNSMYFDISKNNVGDYTNTYSTFLPSITIDWKKKNTAKFSTSFARRVNRPNPMDLNETIIMLDPTTFQKGNINLKQASLSTLTFSYVNAYRNNFFTANIFYGANRNVIFQDVETIQDTLILSKSNLGNVNRFGGVIGHDLSLGKSINIYTSAGVNYNQLKKSDNEQLFNSGYGFICTGNISTKLFNRITTVALFDYNSRRYDLYATTKERPFTSLLLSVNFIKDKVNLRLAYVDVFKINARREIYLSSPSFEQTTYQNRNFSNINIAISYSFGKKFSDAVRNKKIKSDDIQLR